MNKLMRLSALLAFIGNGALFGMEALHDEDSQLMALPIEKREDIYKNVSREINWKERNPRRLPSGDYRRLYGDLIRLSGVSKTLYTEIYAFRKRKTDIPRYKKMRKECNDIALDYENRGLIFESVRMRYMALDYSSLIVSVKSREKLKSLNKLLRKSWMEENGYTDQWFMENGYYENDQTVLDDKS
jgi:hypothetical protein